MNEFDLLDNNDKKLSALVIDCIINTNSLSVKDYEILYNKKD